MTAIRATSFEKKFARWDSRFEAYLERLKSRHKSGGYRSIRYRIETFWKWLKAEQILPQHLADYHFREYVEDLKSGKLCQATESFSLRSLSQLRRSALAWVAHLHQQGDLLLNPFEEFRPGDPPRQFDLHVLSVAQVQEVLDQPDLLTPVGLRNRAIFEVAYGSGLRAGELASMTLASFDLRERFVSLRDTKNKWDRQVPMTLASAHILQRYLRDGRPQLMQDHTPKQALWIGKRGKPLATPGIVVTPQLYRSRVNFHFTMHDFRRAFATHLLEGGANLRLISQLLGHRSIDSSRHYAKAVLRELQTVHQATHPRG